MPNEIIPYLEMCQREGVSLQRGMNFQLGKRDGGKCTKCGSTDDLHFDHIIPWSKGGSSSTAENVQLLCERHNLQKHDRIE